MPLILPTTSYTLIQNGSPRLPGLNITAPSDFVKNIIYSWASVPTLPLEYSNTTSNNYVSARFYRDAANTNQSTVEIWMQCSAPNLLDGFPCASVTFTGGYGSELMLSNNSIAFGLASVGVIFDAVENFAEVAGLVYENDPVPSPYFINVSHQYAVNTTATMTLSEFKIQRVGKDPGGYGLSFAGAF